MGDILATFPGMDLDSRAKARESLEAPTELYGDEARNRKPDNGSDLPSSKATTVTVPTEILANEKEANTVMESVVKTSGGEQECEVNGSAEPDNQGFVEMSKMKLVKRKFKSFWNSECLLSAKALAIFKKQMPKAPGAKAEKVRPNQPMPKKLKSAQNNHYAHFKATKKWSKVFVELRQMERHEACYRQRWRACDWDECPVEKNGARRISAHRAYCCSLSAAYALKRFVLGRATKPKLDILHPHFGRVVDSESSAEPPKTISGSELSTAESFAPEIMDYRHQVSGSGSEINSAYWRSVEYLVRARSGSHPESVTIVEFLDPVSGKSVSGDDSETSSAHSATPEAPFWSQDEAISQFVAYQGKRFTNLLLCAPDFNLSETNDSPKTIDSSEECEVQNTSQTLAPELPSRSPYELLDSPEPSDESIASEVYEDLESTDEESSSDSASESSSVYSDSVSNDASNEPTDEVADDGSYQEPEWEAPATPSTLKRSRFRNKRFVKKLETIVESKALSSSMPKRSNAIKIPKAAQNSLQKFFMKKASQLERVFPHQTKHSGSKSSVDDCEGNDPEMNGSMDSCDLTDCVEFLDFQLYKYPVIFQMEFEDDQTFKQLGPIQKKQYELFDRDCWVRDTKSSWWHELDLDERFVPKLTGGAGIDLKCVCINLRSIQRSELEVSFNNYTTNMKFKVAKCAQESLRLEQLEDGQAHSGTMDKSIKGGFHTFIEIGDIDMTAEFSESETVLQQYELMSAKARSKPECAAAQDFCTHLAHMKAVILAQDKIMGKCQQNLLGCLENYDLIEKYMYSLMANIKAAAASFYNYCVDIGNHEKTRDTYGKLKASFMEISDDVVLMGKMEASVYEGILRIETGFTTRLEHILGNYEKAYSYKMVFHEQFRNTYKTNINCGDLTNREFDSFIGCESDDGQTEFMEKCRVEDVRQIMSEKLERLKKQHEMVRGSREELQSTLEDISVRLDTSVQE